MANATTLLERNETTLACLNNGVSDIAAGVAVVGSEDGIALPGANQTDAILGITRGIIKAGKIGNVMIRGKAIATVGTAGVTAKGRVGYEASTGLIVDWTSAHSIVGIARYTAIAAAQTEVELLGPGATGA